MSVTTAEPVIPSLVDKTEIDAVQEGYGELHRDERAQLGEFSIAAAGMAEMEAKEKTARANVAYLREYAKLLPTAQQLPKELLNEEGRYYFVGHGAEALNTFRQIQKNVLWVSERSAFYSTPDPKRTRTRQLKPYWLIGSTSDREEGTERVLLVPAFEKEGSTNRQPVVLRVFAKDMEHRQAIGDGGFEGFSESEQAKLFDKGSQEFRLSYSGEAGEQNNPIQGNVAVYDSEKRGERSRDAVAKSGVRLRGGWATTKGEWLSSLSADDAEAFDVKTCTAIVASAFGATEQLRELQARLESGAEATQADERLTTSEMLRRMSAMRQDMIAMLTVTMGAEAARDAIDQRYDLSAYSFQDADKLEVSEKQ